MLETYPYVIPKIIDIPDHVSTGLKVYLNGCRGEHYDITLSNGPFRSESGLSLFGHEGPIHEHRDGAGITYGLIIIAEGNHILKVGNKRLPLERGAFFAINSNLHHETSCGPEDFLAFITMDFLHEESNAIYSSPALRSEWKTKDPHLKPDEFALKALELAEKWAKHTAW